MIRVTNSMITQELNNSILSSTASSNLYQEQLATGKQINVPSDNPEGTDQAMTIQSTLNNITQYLSNISTANGFLSASNTQLTSVNSLLQQANQIAVAAANGGTQSSSSMTAYAQQVGALISQVTTLANATYDGQQLFSGQQTNTPPYSATDPTHTYQGDTGSLSTTVGAGQSVTINTPGSTIFDPIFSALQSLQTDIANGDTTSISNNDITALQSAQTNLTTTQAQIGDTVDSLNNQTTALQGAQTDYQNQLSNLVDTNIATAYTNYQEAQNVYQASLVVTSKVLSLSLADYITPS